MRSNSKLPVANAKEAEISDPTLQLLKTYGNFQDSAAKLEAELRKLLEDYLDPEVYEAVFLDSKNMDEEGRYINMNEEQRDRLYFYQAILNLLINFQRVLVPVHDLNESFFNVIGQSNFLGKTKSVWGDSTKIKTSLAEFNRLFQDFMNYVHILEVDTILSRLPTFEKIKALVLKFAPVEMAQAQFENNSFSKSYRENNSAWREFLSLPPVEHSFQNEMDDEEDDDEDEDEDVEYGEYEENEELEEKEEREEEKVPVEEDEASLNLAPVEPQRGRMQKAYIALLQIMQDLTDPNVSDSIEQYQETINLLNAILGQLEAFSKGSKNWKEQFKLVIKARPLVMDLLSSLPQSFSYGNRLVKEQLLIALRQFNLVIKEWYLYASKRNSDLYFKHGLLPTLGQGRQGCGFFVMNTPPKKNPEELDALLGKDKDAYVLSGEKLYYVTRFISKKTGKPFFRGLELPLKPFAHLSENQITLERVIGENGSGERLKPHQLQLLYYLTGHRRKAKKYDDYNLSLANFAGDLDKWAEALGYTFGPNERPPYTEACLAQAEMRLSEFTESKVEHPVKEKYLTQDVEILRKRLEDERKEEESSQRTQRLSLMIYRRRVIDLQMDKRISELRTEIATNWILFTDTKEKKIAALEKLKSKLENDRKRDYDTAFQQMEPQEKDLLEEGRTGKLMQILRLVTSKPGDRLSLIEQALCELQKEQDRSNSYWFRKAARQKRLAKRLAAVQAFQAEYLNHPEYRAQEILDRLKHEDYAILTQKEGDLLESIKEIDSYLPDFVLGKKVVNFGEEVLKEAAEGLNQKRAAKLAGPGSPGFFHPVKKKNGFMVEALSDDTPVEPHGRKLQKN